MKVRELQAELNKLDPDLEVVCYTEDERLVAEGCLFTLLDFLAVQKVDAKRSRLPDGSPTLVLGKSPESEPIATLEVTSEF